MSGLTIAVLASLVILTSTLIRATFGFGNALLAMPLLVLLLGVREASPLVALVGLVISALMLLRGWQALQWKEILVLLLASLPGVPLGLLLLTSLPEPAVRKLLGLVLAGFGVYNLSGIKLPKVDGGWLAVPFGLLAGVLGGAYNTNGPPVLIYGYLRGWDKDQFRASLQGFFLVSNLMVIAGHGLAGLWTPRVLILFGISIPLAAGAVLIGERLASRLSQAAFDRAVHYLLILLGALMFI